MKQENQKIYLNWFLLSLFYAYQYLLRIYPSTFTDNIRVTFNFSAHEFATLSTYCIFIYSCMQIPFGILLDKVGIRGLILNSFGLCLIGQFLFTHTQSTECAQWGRILIGIGAAPAFMSTVKIVSDTFSDKHCGIFIGTTCTLGTIIVILGNGLLKYIYTITNNWQETLQYLNIVGVILFIICLFFLSQTNPKKEKTNVSFIKIFLSVVTNYKIFLYALLTVGTSSVATTLSDLWGNTFLITKYNLSDIQAVFYNQFIFAGFLIGALVVPMLFNGSNKSLRGVRICCIILICLFGILIYGSNKMLAFALQAILFSLGFFACADILCYALAAQLSTTQTSGLIVGWVNTINMLGLTFLQYLVARSLDKYWAGSINANGLRLYEARDYELALGVLLNTVIISLFIACLMKNRNTKSK